MFFGHFDQKQKCSVFTFVEYRSNLHRTRNICTCMFVREEMSPLNDVVDTMTSHLFHTIFV